MKHIYIIYKITNKVNNKFYIGVHKTNDINDGYMGSGIYLRRAIDKHGLQNFTKEILHIFTNKIEAFRKEKEIVTDNFLNTENCYNIKKGGHGGFDFINKTGKGRSCLNRKLMYHPLTNKQYKATAAEVDARLAQGWKLGFSPRHVKRMSLAGKRKIQSPEARRKNSETKKDATILVAPEGYKKFIKKAEVDSYLSMGWVQWKWRRKTQ